MDTLKEIVDFEIMLHNSNAVSMLYFASIMIPILVITTLAMLLFSTCAILMAFKAILMGIAYRLSPAMQATDAEVAKLEASRPRLSLGEWFKSKPKAPTIPQVEKPNQPKQNLTER